MLLESIHRETNKDSLIAKIYIVGTSKNQQNKIEIKVIDRCCLLIGELVPGCKGPTSLEEE